MDTFFGRPRGFPESFLALLTVEVTAGLLYAFGGRPRRFPRGVVAPFVTPLTVLGKPSESKAAAIGTSVTPTDAAAGPP